MVQNDTRSSSERQQTDDSLRTERERVDHTFGEELSAIDEVADAVIIRARRRADEVLAIARERTDRWSATPGQSAQLSENLESTRGIEDRAVRQERADADEVVRMERAEHVAMHSIDRAETDRDLLTERARTDNALAMRDEFLGIVSHELRSQLNAMTLFATLISQEVLQENHVAQVLLHAQRSQRVGARMNRLIGDLVDVASIEAGMLAVRREVLDPTPIVAEAVHTFQAQAAKGQISLSSEIVQPLPLAAMDPARILQVLINLLSNAIKFTPAAGKVVIRVDRIGEEIRFAVSDSGAGIPVAKFEAVFERCVQVNADRRGLGLGLYISKCIVQGHGGRIWVESALGEGSTLCFTVPITSRSSPL
jgi:signal transduction histidine kinase